MKRGASYWFLITGLVLGGLAGAGYAWLADPVSYVDSAPFFLPPAYRDEYRAQVAAAYAATGDLPRALARLENLRDEDPRQALAYQAQQLAGQGSYEAARALAMLALALDQSTALTPVPGAPAADPTSSPASPAAGTPLGGSPAPSAAATSTPVVIPTAGPPFTAEESRSVCDVRLPGALQVWVEDSAGEPVPGMQVIVSWDDGEDYFYTGLKPAIGAGYADFQMTEGFTYTVRLGDGGEPVKGISSSECPEQAGSQVYQGGWLVLFKQP